MVNKCTKSTRYILFTCMLVIWYTCTLAVDSSNSNNPKNNNNNNNNNGQVTQQHDTSQQLPEYKEMVVHIPQYGKVVGRREEGVDVWRGIPYAGMLCGLFLFSYLIFVGLLDTATYLL